MLKTQVGSCSILEKAHFTNASLCAVSAGKSSWHDCNLYGYSWKIRRRILRTDNGGNPNRLAASRALLVPEAASDAIASISTAMQGARASFKHGHPARARSSYFPVSSKRLTSFKRHAAGLGPDKSRQDDLKYRKIREETNGMNFNNFFFRTSDCIENDTTMEDDSFRQESPVNTSRETFFFPEFDLNKFSSLKSFLECFDKQCLEYQKDEQWKKQNIPRYLTGVYLKFWYENHLFEKSYQEIKQLLMTVFDATKQEDIRRFHKLKLNDTKELISFFTEKLSLGKKLNYDDSSIVEHMTLSSPREFQKFLVIKKISTPCEWISTMRQLIAVTPDSADRKPVDTGSYTRWNHAYGSVHRGTGQQYRFQARGNHGQPHQSHMMRFSGRQQFNNQPRQFVQQNRHFNSPRNESNQRQG
ncbi:hypothetical protein TNCV_1066441 [Trichonephila clavipes]|uniref:Uncharacterized protein n=1 Tax=Trichonephila clavipes TaxID=2585209 RepID=A0A8X6UUJ5_TRICX|nr:hypothetical protein TNCV_1066441 [Trichonephila clavipes]